MPLIDLDAAIAAIPTGWTGKPHQSNMDYGPNVAGKAVAALRALPAVTADPLGADWMRREAKNRVRDLIYWDGDDGTTLVALRDAAAALDAIPGPTEADLDRAALARPVVAKLVEIGRAHV